MMFEGVDEGVTEVCDCVCGHVEYLITRCGIPPCLHPQINNVGERGRDQSKLCNEEREWETKRKATLYAVFIFPASSINNILPTLTWRESVCVYYSERDAKRFEMIKQ